MRSPLPPGFSEACTNTCANAAFARDGACDDGGEGSEYSACTQGSDCDDCGPRPVVGGGDGGGGAPSAANSTFAAGATSSAMSALGDEIVFPAFGMIAGVAGGVILVALLACCCCVWWWQQQSRNGAQQAYARNFEVHPSAQGVAGQSPRSLVSLAARDEAASMYRSDGGGGICMAESMVMSIASKTGVGAIPVVVAQPIGTYSTKL